jgi:hypothetical protein
VSAKVEPLHQEDVPALRALLARDVPSNMYLLGLLAEFGIAPPADRAPFAFYGNRQGRELSAAVFVGGSGGLVVPSANDEREIAPIAEHLSKPVRLRAALGEKQAVDTIVRYLCPERPRLSKFQRIFAVSADDLGPFTNPALRLATEADMPQLVPIAAAALRETMGQDPLAREADAFKAAVLRRIRGRRTWVLEANKRLVFKIDVGSRSQHGAELEGLYTVQEERRRGHATLSLGQISRHLLASLPCLTLRVNEDNPSIAGLARKVGYVAGKMHRLVVAD